MAENAGEDSSANIDLICALCDNGGEIARCVHLFTLLSALNKV